MSDSRSSTIKPRLLVEMPRSDESSRSHLLGIQAESYTSRTVLSFGNSAYAVIAVRTSS